MLSYEAFNYITYVFNFFTIILVTLFIVIVFLKKYVKLITWFTVVSISFICIVVSALNLIFLGYAADEMNLQSTECFYMFIAIIGLSAINSIISYRNRSQS
ncbi:hypothetical protein ACFFIX_03330 [Metabacillus herbersteinensis]|uniref:3-isopropylmalate dehydrogenase n=1 Tax=Metabacillus herbersteinensis TaxID=283816 RepID=A0ABV6GAC2_9BACI